MKQTGVKEYFKCLSLDEANSILNDYKGEIRIIAGATDFFADDHPDVEALIDISDLELSYIKEEDRFLKIGSLATMNEIVNSKVIDSNFHAIREAARVLGDKTVRNTATIGGNICSSVPSADSVPSLIVLGATLIIKTPSVEKSINIEDFFIGPRENVLKKNEILKEIRIPLQNGHHGSAFEKITRNSEDLAMVNAAAFITVDNEKNIKDAKVALGAVGPTAVRAKELEESLVGTKLDEEKLEELLEMVKGAISPISDIRCSEDYRQHVSKILVKRAIIKAYQRAIEKI